MTARMANLREIDGKNFEKKYKNKLKKIGITNILEILGFIMNFTKAINKIPGSMMANLREIEGKNRENS